MGQFIFGLIAGVVVGLVMEWVIDWTGLVPKRTIARREKTPASLDRGTGAGRHEADAAPPSSAEKSLREHNDLGRE